MRAGASLRWAGVFVGGLAVAIAISARADEPAQTPWPGGEAPDEPTFARWVDEAVELGAREAADEAVAAVEPAEGREALAVSQERLDQGGDINDILFRLGDSIFSHEFDRADGFGAGASGKLRRIHTGVRGGLDSHACSSCHSVGGVDGAGSETQRAFVEGDGVRESSALARNAPQVIGGGIVQALALEMTRELAASRDVALLQAKTSGAPVTVALKAKGVSFGALTVDPGGSLDTTRVEGVSTDLVVRPFGWKGNVATLRRFAEDAARVHFGIQSTVIAASQEKNPDVVRFGPGPGADPDNDGVVRELEEGALSAMAIYMAMLESPAVRVPFDLGLRERWARGSATFDAVACATCHTRELTLLGVSWRELPDTTGGPGNLVYIMTEGDQPKSSANVRLFSDLKRHDMGPELADRHVGSDGIPTSVFLTRPLWGLADTAPYLHDGRAPSLPEAIVAHGGEATASRDAYLALSADGKADLHVFLLSLSRAQRLRMAR